MSDALLGAITGSILAFTIIGIILIIIAGVAKWRS